MKAMTMASPRPLARLLSPRAIAIVGASADARSFGGFVQGNLERFGYSGALHLVSRSSREIRGRPCASDVSELPEDLDVAVLAIPEAGVLEAVRALAARRCHAAVLFASGYAEVGEAGRERQEELVRAAGAMALVGPNCMGYTHYESGAALTFEPLEAPPPRAAFADEPTSTSTSTDTLIAAHTRPRPARRGIGIAAQSGFMAATMRDAFSGRGLPLTTVFSTGNEASVGLEDVLAHYLDDAATGVVALYAEQLRRPALFVALARRARAQGTPIVLLMPGRSVRAQAAAASHTGALAGDHATALAALTREAVVCVASLDELFDTTALLLQHPVPGAGGTAFVTGSGAMKNLALDFADAAGLALPALALSTVEALKAKLPSYALAENPLDYTTIGVRQPGLIGEILDVLAADPHVGSLVLSIPVGPEMAQRDKAAHIVPALARCTKPAVLVLTGDTGPVQPFFLAAIEGAGVTMFRSADRALRALAQVAQHAGALERAARADRAATTAATAMTGAMAATEASTATLAATTATATAVSAAAALPWPAPIPANGIFAEHHGKRWLTAAGIAVPRGELARHADEAAAAAQRIGYPVVLKAQASELPHKSDVGGVIVGLADEVALRAGYTRLTASVAQHRPGLVLDGVLVEAMGARGIELVVGARRDADWGPVLLVGLGGVWVEVLKDVRLLPPDLAHEDIVAELQALQAAPLLAGVRGAPGADLHAVARVVAALGAQMLANPGIAEVDINPLAATPGGAVALDALLVAAPEAA